MNTDVPIRTPSADAGESDDSGEPGSPELAHPPRPDFGSHDRSAVDADVVLVDDAGSTDVDLERLESLIRAAAREVDRPVRSIEVELVDDARMRALHAEHLGVDRTTDVMTFDLTDAGEAAVEASIVLCVDEARRRGEELGHGVERELLLYALHGLLHCCGYDDHDEAGYRRMHAEEDRILERIGVGRTFATGDRPGHGGSDAIEDRDTEETE